jgi:hypothetical protein
VEYLIEFGTGLKKSIYKKLQELGYPDQLYWRRITRAV